jgi:hypothetical protein
LDRITGLTLGSGRSEAEIPMNWLEGGMFIGNPRYWILDKVNFRFWIADFGLDNQNPK